MGASYTRPTIVAITCIAAVLPGFVASAAEVAFELSDPTLIPEGIAYDDDTERFFVSSTYRRKIVVVAADGKASDFVQTAEGGLLGVLGLRVDSERRHLWAVSSHAGEGMPIMDPDLDIEGTSRLHQYDVDTGELINRYQTDNGTSSFLNDLTIARDGSVYVTDSEANRIYLVRDGAKDLHLFYQLEDSMPPNGIDISSDQRHLYVAVYGGNNAVRIDIDAGSLSRVVLPEGEEIFADGLYVHRGNLIAIQPWNTGQTIARYVLDGRGLNVNRVEVLDNSSEQLLQPTTGVIVGDAFYFIANSQLQVFRRLYNAQESLSGLTNPVILRLPL